MIEQLFFELIRVAIGTQEVLSRPPSAKEWQTLYDMAKKQSLVGICFAGVQKTLSHSVTSGNACQSKNSPSKGENPDIFEPSETSEALWNLPELLYLKWMGMAAKIQQKWEQHEAFIGRLAGFYGRHGLDMMLLKGYGLSLSYPEAKLRNPGDVDVYLSWSQEVQDVEKIQAWKKADDAVREEIGVEVRNDSEHHTKFLVDDISVENHYDFVNTRIRKSSQKLEKVFKALAKDKTNVVDVQGHKVILPSDKLNAIFLLRHCAGHFASEGITLRNVLDWGLFVRSAKELDWEWLWQTAKAYNMHRFLGCLNMICVEDFALDKGKFLLRYEDKILKERVLTEMMQGTDLVDDASAWVRTKRWWQHRWKHRICYSDSMLSSFVYSVRANLMGVSIE